MRGAGGAAVSISVPALFLVANHAMLSTDVSQSQPFLGVLSALPPVVSIRRFSDEMLLLPPKRAFLLGRVFRFAVMPLSVSYVVPFGSRMGLFRVVEQRYAGSS